MKILILKLGSIGDIIHALPAVAFLRKAMPEAQIDWLVERYARSILKHAKNIDRVVEIDTLRWRRSFFEPATLREILRIARDLRRARYDVVLELQGLWKSAFIASIVSAKQVVGGERRFIREPGSSLFYSRRVDREAGHEHVIFEHFRIVESFLQSLPNAPLYKVPNLLQIEFDQLAAEEDRRWVDEQLERFKISDFFILNPGANWKSKWWPLENYALLARRLQDASYLSIVITVGPSEKALGEELQKRLEGCSLTLVTPTLNQLAALAERAKLFVGPDTGPLHLAAACRTPIVGVYASTDPARNGPFNPADIVRHRNRCGEFCYRRDCGARRCITSISVDEVLEAAKRRLEKVPGVQ